MTIVVNWVEQQRSTDNCIEIPLFGEKFLIYYIDNVISKTEWRVEQVDLLLEESNKWQEIQQYLNKPIASITVNLKKQGSSFRHKVWTEMAKIPVGQTVTYSELAAQIGSGARAVANACRDNPFPGIIPCHRVVAVNGLGGYMGQTSGRCLDIKSKFLASEAVFSQQEILARKK
jgi:methylated-DNA-[protein]-cysteine S-methyltransferase